MPDLDPANDNDDKKKFYLRVRSQMIAQGVEGIIDSDSWTELMNKKRHFTWCTSTGDEFFDGAMMVKLSMDACDPETKVTIQMLRSKITGTKSAEFHHNVMKMLDHISSTMNLITELGETHDSLLKDTFDALLTAPNSRFHQFFEIEKTRWEGGKDYTYDSLSEYAASTCDNVVSNGTWNMIDEKDKQIIASRTEVEELKSNKNSANNDSMATSDRGKFGKLLPWRKTNVSDKIFKDGYWWWWCPKHSGSDFDGLHVRHKPEDHDAAIARRSKFNKDKSKSKDTPATKVDRKLTLSKEMKATLLTVGAFTEEQADEIVKETQANLPKDF